MDFVGDKALERTLRTLGDRVQRKIVRSAVNAAATPVLKAARANVTTESGLLKKSLAKKVGTSKDKTSVTAIVGPRRDVQGEYEGEMRKPSRYAHLVEKGFINEAGEYVPPKPFLRPAAESTEQQAIGVMSSKLAAGVVKEAAKAGVT